MTKNISKQQGASHLIILSALDVWSMPNKSGAPSLHRTITSLAKDYDVTFITCNRNKKSLNNDLFGVSVIRFGLPWLQQLFHPDHPLRIIGTILYPFWWLYFQLHAGVLILQTLRKKPPVAMYAYEITAVPIMKFLSALKGLPLIARFQGTVLFPLLNNPLSYITHFHHYLALKTRADIVIMTNDGTRGNQVLKKLNNQSRQILFWMNGVDKPPTISPNKTNQLKNRLGILSAHIVLLSVSRLKQWKRVDRIIDALHQLNNDKVHLVIVGDGPEKKYLKERAHKHTLGDRVHFCGNIPHEYLAEYYALADIFLSCYSLSNIGNPLLEAMRAGKPIITIDNGDTAQLIIDKKNGLLLPEGDISLISNSINTLITDTELSARLGHAAQKYAQKNFITWEQRMEKERQVINNLTKLTVYTE